MGRRTGVLDRLPDTTAALLAQGYRWGGRVCAAHGADAARTRLTLQRAVVVRGAENARRFYSGDLRRAGASPRRVQRTLFGTGGVQGLDGEQHGLRRAMFLDLLGPERADELAGVVVRHWRDRLAGWERRPRVRLLDEVGEILTSAVCDWAGVPLTGRAEARQLHGRFESLIEAAAAVGPRFRRGVRDRHRLERWGARLVERVRSGSLVPPATSALAAVAGHRGPDGALLTPRIAAVELLNVLRPTVAIDRFVVWGALALHEHPEWRAPLSDDQAVRRFALEVRRTAPFFPLVAARAESPARFDGATAEAGDLVLLDLYATNHDAHAWDRPEAFDPDRFLAREPTPFDLVPQGGGDHATGHRCAGEWVTTAVLSAAVRLLSQEIDYVVPPQDLSVDLRRIPARPASGLVLTEVRRV